MLSSHASREHSAERVRLSRDRQVDRLTTKKVAARLKGSNDPEVDGKEMQEHDLRPGQCSSITGVSDAGDADRAATSNDPPVIQPARIAHPAI